MTGPRSGAGSDGQRPATKRLQVLFLLELTLFLLVRLLPTLFFVGVVIWGKAYDTPRESPQEEFGRKFERIIQRLSKTDPGR